MGVHKHTKKMVSDAKQADDVSNQGEGGESSPIVIEPLGNLLTADELEAVDTALDDSDSSDDEQVEKRRYVNDLIMFRKASQTYATLFSLLVTMRFFFFLKKKKSVLV